MPKKILEDVVSLLIVITTHERCDLLDRTLKSLAECGIPSNLEKVIVAENGTKSGADQVVKKYVDRLPLTYQFTEKPNKSNALTRSFKKPAMNLSCFSMMMFGFTPIPLSIMRKK